MEFTDKTTNTRQDTTLTVHYANNDKSMETVQYSTVEYSTETSESGN